MTAIPIYLLQCCGHAFAAVLFITWNNNRTVKLLLQQEHTVQHSQEHVEQSNEQAGHTTGQSESSDNQLELASKPVRPSERDSQQMQQQAERLDGHMRGSEQPQIPGTFSLMRADRDDVADGGSPAATAARAVAGLTAGLLPHELLRPLLEAQECPLFRVGKCAVFLVVLQHAMHFPKDVLRAQAQACELGVGVCKYGCDAGCSAWNEVASSGHCDSPFTVPGTPLFRLYMCGMVRWVGRWVGGCVGGWVLEGVGSHTVVPWTPCWEPSR